MSENKRKIAPLFDIYSKNLTTVNPKYNDIYACPLCLRKFSKSSLEDGMLTVEHIIPDKLKGKIYILLCKECNSKCGRDIDIHLVNKIEADEFFSGNSNKPLKAEFIVGEGITRGDFYINKEGNPMLKLIGKPNLAHPNQTQKSIEAMNNKDISITINGNMGYNPNICTIALLKIGYLILFSCLGYGYIFHKPLEIIRSQILVPEKRIVEPKVFTLFERITDKFKVMYVYSPIKYKCFLAVIDLPTSNKRSLAIVLPGLDDFDCEIYKRLCDYDPKSSKEKLLMKEIIFEPQWLINPEYARRAEVIWSVKYEK